MYANSLLLRRSSAHEDQDLSDAMREKEQKFHQLDALAAAAEKGHKEEVNKPFSAYKGSKEPIEKLIIKITALENDHEAAAQKVIQFRAEADDLQTALKQFEETHKTEREKFQTEKDEEHRIEAEKRTMEINRLTEQIRIRDDYIHEILKSMSWKITAPLRKVSKPLIERKRN